MHRKFIFRGFFLYLCYTKSNIFVFAKVAFINIKHKAMKLYHVSLKRNYKPGDIIHPSSIKQYTGGWSVYCSASPKPHGTLFSFGGRSLGKVKHNTYEVKPLHNKTKIRYGACWDELIVEGAVEVVACLGQTNTSKNRCSYVVRKFNGNTPIVFNYESVGKKKKYKQFKHNKLRVHGLPNSYNESNG